MVTQPIVIKTDLIDKSLVAVVERYFKAFNENNFAAAADLFAAAGELCPPFDSKIVGRAAIADYLTQEATQMTACPKRLDSLEDGHLRVVGLVDAIAFKVGVEWIFTFAATSEILSLSIRLRASMKELLSIRPG